MQYGPYCMALNKKIRNDGYRFIFRFCSSYSCSSRSSYLSPKIQLGWPLPMFVRLIIYESKYRQQYYDLFSLNNLYHIHQWAPELRSKGLDSKPMIDFQPIDLTYQGIEKTSLIMALLRNTFRSQYNIITTSFQIKAPNVMARSDIGFPFLVPLSKPILKGIWDPLILRTWMTFWTVSVILKRW